MTSTHRGGKYYTNTNTLAYLETTTMIKKKRFMAMTCGRSEYYGNTNALAYLETTAMMKKKFYGNDTQKRQILF
jgi:hypothetical protein